MEKKHTLVMEKDTYMKLKRRVMKRSGGICTEAYRIMSSFLCRSRMDETSMFRLFELAGGKAYFEKAENEPDTVGDVWYGYLDIDESYFLGVSEMRTKKSSACVSAFYDTRTVMNLETESVTPDDIEIAVDMISHAASFGKNKAKRKELEYVGKAAEIAKMYSSWMKGMLEVNVSNGKAEAFMTTRRGGIEIKIDVSESGIHITVGSSKFMELTEIMVGLDDVEKAYRGMTRLIKEYRKELAYVDNNFKGARCDYYELLLWLKEHDIAYV